MDGEKTKLDDEDMKRFQERFDYDPYEDEFICTNTRQLRPECRCLDCMPRWFRFKFMCMDCENIDEVIKTLESTTEYFRELKEKGYTVGGPIPDDYMEIYPPKVEGYYWARCEECGKAFMVQKGAMYPRTCDTCDLEDGDVNESDKFID